MPPGALDNRAFDRSSIDVLCGRRPKCLEWRRYSFAFSMESLAGRFGEPVKLGLRSCCVEPQTRCQFLEGPASKQSNCDSPHGWRSRCEECIHFILRFEASTLSRSRVLNIDEIVNGYASRHAPVPAQPCKFVSGTTNQESHADRGPGLSNQMPSHLLRQVFAVNSIPFGLGAHEAGISSQEGLGLAFCHGVPPYPSDRKNGRSGFRNFDKFRFSYLSPPGDRERSIAH